MRFCNTDFNTFKLLLLLLLLKFVRWVHVSNLCSILKLVYFDSWSWQSFLSTCDVFSFSTGCTKWNSAANKSLQLFMASLFIGFLVEKYVACESRKSDFGWHRFRFSPCLMRKRVEKSEAILALLDRHQGIIPWVLWLKMFFHNEVDTQNGR